MALRQVATGFLRSHPLPSGGRRCEKTSTVWRQVATRFLRSHPLPSGGRRERKPPPSGDRWLPASYVATRCQAVDNARENLHRLATGGYRRQVATGFLRSHPLPSGGRRARKPPPSGDRWLPATGGYWRQVATASTQAMGPRSLYPVPTSDAEIASDVHARHILHHPVNQELRRCPLPARTPDPPKGDGRQKQGGF